MRAAGELCAGEPHDVDYIDVSPKQLCFCGRVAGSLPEHDDANRALWAPTCSGNPFAAGGRSSAGWNRNGGCARHATQAP